MKPVWRYQERYDALGWWEKFKFHQSPLQWISHWKLEEVNETLRSVREELEASNRRIYSQAAFVKVLAREADAEAKLAEVRELLRRVEELANRAVLALHMAVHAGINSPNFKDCQQQCCVDLRELKAVLSLALAQAEGK